MTIEEKVKAYDKIVEDIESSAINAAYEKGFAAGVKSVVEKFNKTQIHYKSMEGYIECLNILIEKFEFDYSILGSNRIYHTLKALRAALKRINQKYTPIV